MTFNKHKYFLILEKKIHIYTNKHKEVVQTKTVLLFFFIVAKRLTDQSRQILTPYTTHAVLLGWSLAKTMSTGMKIRV